MIGQGAHGPAFVLVVLLSACGVVFTVLGALLVLDDFIRRVRRYRGRPDRSYLDAILWRR